MVGTKIPLKTNKKTEKVEETPISTISSNDVLNHVLSLLGRPKDLCQTSPNLTRATPITQNRFRVNVCRYTPNPTLTDTFFVYTNDIGQVIKSYPEITKRY